MLDDLLSGTGLRIGYAILLSVPVIGPWLTFLFMGGTIPNPATLPRMFALHIFLVPALISALLGLHLFMIWRQLHTNLSGPKSHQPHHCGVAAVAVLHGQVDRPASAGVWRDRRAGRPGPDRSRLDLRALRPCKHHGGRAAGLVSRLGGGSNTSLSRYQSASWTLADSRNFSSLLS